MVFGTSLCSTIFKCKTILLSAFSERGSKSENGCVSLTLTFTNFYTQFKCVLERTRIYRIKIKYRLFNPHPPRQLGQHLYKTLIALFTTERDIWIMWIKNITKLNIIFFGILCAKYDRSSNARLLRILPGIVVPKI